MKKIINSSNDPLYRMVGAIMRVGFEGEGSSYFSEECQIHSGKRCGSFWTELTNIDIGYLNKKAELYFECNG